MSRTVCIPRESTALERRVAASPDSVKKLVAAGYTVRVEAGAGTESSFTDDAYRKAGAEIVEDTRALWRSADVLLKVRAPAMHPALGEDEVGWLKEGALLVSFIWPAQNPELVEKLRARNVTVLGVDAIPRTSRAQSMDALSSMGNIAGYRAVIEAAQVFGGFFAPQMTAAGKLPPAKVLIIGAGVAGLAAIAAARGLGAVVRAFDTRPAVKDQVKSLGAEFLEVHIAESGEGQGGYAREMSPEFIAAEMALFAAQAREVDMIITTALIPGKPAPRLITREMVESMRPGSVIVDLAAEQGGNCELTQAGKRVDHGGVRILGYADMPSRLPTTSSQLYANNLVNLLALLGGAEKFNIPLEDDIIRGALITHQGKVTWPPPKPAVPSPAAVAPAPTPPKAAPVEVHHDGPMRGPARRSFVYEALALVGVLAWTYGMMTLRGEASLEMQQFIQHFTVFVLACFVGWQVIWNVAPALHTPLMSVTNAISGIIILGGMLQLDGPLASAHVLLGSASILLATINIAGGFLVTHRMLKMFHR